MLDYGTLCIKTFRVHGFDIILITTMTFFLMKLLPVLRLKPGEAITGTQKEIILEKYGLNDPVLFNMHVT